MNSRENTSQKSAEQESAERGIETPGPESIKVDVRQAVLGGILATAVTLGGTMLVGETSGLEARQLLETSLSSTRSFCGTVALATGNILALMLTLLGLSLSADVELKWSHYQRIRQIAWIDAMTLIGAVLTYLLLNVPLRESEAAAEQVDPWFLVLYYATLVLASLLGGALITVVLMLLNAVKDVIETVGPTENNRLARSGSKSK